MTRTIVLLFLALSCVGCGASIKLEPGEQPLPEFLPEARFYLTVQDGSDSKPDNWDGNLNLLWTNEEKRAAVVEKNIKMLIDGFEQNGFMFVGSENDGTVIANLEFKSVRFDPIGGWITDDARIAYTDAGTGGSLGTVVADERWTTPTVEMVFRALLKGSLKLWGQSNE